MIVEPTAPERILAYLNVSPCAFLADIAGHLKFTHVLTLRVLNRMVEDGMAERFRIVAENRQPKTVERVADRFPPKNIRFYYYPAGWSHETVIHAWYVKTQNAPRTGDVNREELSCLK